MSVCVWGGGVGVIYLDFSSQAHVFTGDPVIQNNIHFWYSNKWDKDSWGSRESQRVFDIHLSVA